jgi:hypothetical protein
MFPMGDRIHVFALEPRGGCPGLAASTQFDHPRHPATLGSVELDLNHDGSLLAFRIDGGGVTVVDLGRGHRSGEICSTSPRL